jgi:hypothetical protein
MWASPQSERLEQFCSYTVSCVIDVCPVHMEILAPKMGASQINTRNNVAASLNTALAILISFKFSKLLRPSP